MEETNQGIGVQTWDGDVGSGMILFTCTYGRGSLWSGTGLEINGCEERLSKGFTLAWVISLT